VLPHTHRTCGDGRTVGVKIRIETLGNGLLTAFSRVIDYSKTTFSGPNFQFRDVNYNDLHLTGDNVPDTFGVGLNIHIIATVEEYSETSGLFQLKPVSIKMR
jgi:hypothetical protein